TMRWEQTIVLFDNVSGGAGHVLRIKEEFSRIIEEALRIVNCVDCAPETSCYHCLRDFNNQWEHHLLKRGRVITFLETIQTSLATTPADTDVAGAHYVVAIDPTRWL